MFVQSSRCNVAVGAVVLASEDTLSAMKALSFSGNSNVFKNDIFISKKKFTKRKKKHNTLYMGIIQNKRKH